MGYRILDVKVAKIDLGTNKLVTRKSKITAGNKRDLRNIFVLDTCTLITGSNNQTIPLSEIKVGNRVTIDFIKVPDNKLLAKGISVSKSY